jgi:hypothetical protein
MIFLLLISLCIAQHFPLASKNLGAKLVEQTIKLSESYKNELVSALEIFPNCEANKKMLSDEPLTRFESSPLPVDRSTHADGADAVVESEMTLSQAATRKKFEQEPLADSPCNYGRPYLAPGLTVWRFLCLLALTPSHG